MNQRVGHRFHPTDGELINYFLKNKVLGHDYKVEEDISEVDICKWEPWELPNRAVNKPGDDDPEWFFFCLRDYKYSNSRRANRTTKVGYWKATGKDRKIWSKKGPKKQIGIKKTLVFYKGRVPNGIRTNWVIHEYHPTDPDFPNERAYVICRLKKNSDEKADDSIPDEGASSSHACFPYGNISENTAPEDNQLFPSNLGSLINNGLVNFDSLALLESQMHLEQGQNFSFTNGFCNDLIRTQCYVNSSEQENEDFIDSLIVDPFEETVHTDRNGSSPTQSLKKYGQVQGKSFIGHVSSKECQQMQMVQASTGILSRDSSVNSFTNIPEISCLELVSEEIPTRKSQYHPRFQLQRALPTIVELQDDFSCKAVITDKDILLQVGEATKHGTAVDMLKKENSNVESNKDLKMTKKTNTKSLKSRWNDEPTGTEREGLFMFLDTPQLSHNSNPPSVYFIKTLLGIILIIGVIWELILFGDWS